MEVAVCDSKSCNISRADNPPLCKNHSEDQWAAKNVEKCGETFLYCGASATDGLRWGMQESFFFKIKKIQNLIYEVCKMHVYENAYLYDTY